MSNKSLNDLGITAIAIHGGSSHATLQSKIDVWCIAALVDETVPKMSLDRVFQLHVDLEDFQEVLVTLGKGGVWVVGTGELNCAWVPDDVFVLWKELVPKAIFDRYRAIDVNSEVLVCLPEATEVTVTDVDGKVNGPVLCEGLLIRTTRKGTDFGFLGGDQ